MHSTHQGNIKTWEELDLIFTREAIIIHFNGIDIPIHLNVELSKVFTSENKSFVGISLLRTLRKHNIE